MDCPVGKYKGTVKICQHVEEFILSEEYSKIFDIPRVNQEELQEEINNFVEFLFHDAMENFEDFQTFYKKNYDVYGLPKNNDNLQ